MPEFKTGDIVQLNSGGPKMTVKGTSGDHIQRASIATTSSSRRGMTSSAHCTVRLLQS